MLCLRPVRRRREGLALRSDNAHGRAATIRLEPKGAPCPHNSAISPAGCPSRPRSTSSPSPSAQGAGQGRRRAADRRQPVRQHGSAPSAAGMRGHRGRPDRTTARRRACRSSARRRREFVREEFGIPVEAENVVVGPGRQGLRAVLLRGVPRTRRRRPRLQPALPDLRAEHRAPRRARRARAAAAGERVPPRPRRRRAVPRRRPVAARRSSSTRRTTRPAASPPSDDLRGIADLVRGKRHRRLQRRAVLPHGLGAAGTTRCWRSRACSTSASAAYTFSKSYSMSGWRLGFAVGVRRGRRGDRQDDQHVALVRAADRAARRRRRRSSTTPPSATR